MFQGTFVQLQPTSNSELTKNHLVHLSKEWMDAMLKHDSATLNKLMAPEYTLRSWDGNASNVTPRATWLYNLFNHLKIIKWDQTSMAAQVYGDVAIVTSLYSWSGTFGARAFDSKGFLADIWMKKNNHWQVTSRTSGAHPESKTIDGKTPK